MTTIRRISRTSGYLFSRLFRHDVWNIGIVDGPIHTFLTPGAHPTVRWLPEPPRGHFLADPFMVETGDGPVILAEGSSYAAGQGHIAALTALPGGGFGPPMPVIAEPMLPYPFVVERAGRIFCIPESGTARAVSCYEATDFPYR